MATPVAGSGAESGPKTNVTGFNTLRVNPEDQKTRIFIAPPLLRLQTCYAHIWNPWDQAQTMGYFLIGEVDRHTPLKI